jgi:ATP-dependent protease ClpP protease subunit
MPLDTAFAAPVLDRAPFSSREITPDLRQAFSAPQIRLAGGINQPMLVWMINQFDSLWAAEGPIVLDLTTDGGEADTARRMALEVRLRREAYGRRMIFLGKTMVYSAGVTVMSAFPVQDRYLTADTRLLVHQRHIQKKIEFCDPLTAAAQRVREVLSDIEAGLELEQEGFRRFIEGSDVSLEECVERAASNWYISAEEAVQRGLVAGLV